MDAFETPAWRLHPSHQRSMRGVAKLLFILAMIQFITWVIPPTPGSKGIDYYLSLHSLMETGAIVISMMVFAVGWNSQGNKSSGNLVILACFFFAVGWMDFAHTESYGGMPDFLSPNGSEKHLSFWLSGRLLAAIALLIVTLRPWSIAISNFNKYLIFSTLISATCVSSWVFIYHVDWVPALFIPGHGLTPLKKNLEYLFIAINLVTAVILWHKMRRPLGFNAPLLFAAVATMALSEFFFTLYTTMTGAYNVLGHVYKVISYVLIYRAVVVEAIDRPYLELAAAQQTLLQSLKDKEALLKEVHHRVKNNLQVISSLLRLESRRSTQSSTRDVLREMQARIRSMALLHQTLYRSGTFASVNLSDYLKEVATQAFQAHLIGSNHIQLKLNMASLDVGMDQAIACGLLVNELISNALKHAFPDTHSGEIGITLQPVDNSGLWRVSLNDNGIGLSSDFEVRRKNSLGLQLVDDLTQQMDGILTTDSKPGQHTEFAVVFRAAAPAPLVMPT